MLARGVDSPATSSMGRYFDAAAGLLGVKPRMAFEGQAAMLLEGLAERHGRVAPDDGLFAIGGTNELDLSPLLARLADESDAGFGAALFHATIVRALAAWVARSARAHGIAIVACGGGCFLHAILARDLRTELAARGLVMVEAMAVPPNDGGLSLGQAWVALRRWRREIDMCLALPAKVVALPEPDTALIDVDGVRKWVSLALVDGVALGDYVIVHVGYALARLDPDEAARTLALFTEAGLVPAATAEAT